jgi:GNAT superfamily N-acetyltransferase
MITIKRTKSTDKNFQELIKILDAELKIRDGEDHAFYAVLNKSEDIKHVLVAYENEEAVGCGSVRFYAPGIMEVKRMFVPLNHRGKGIASAILTALELWCVELDVKKCILETGVNQPEAIALYKKCNYKIIPNFGKYENVENSVCFEKELVIED